MSTDLAASSFDNYKLETTRFFKSNLDFILVENVKVWKLKGWVEVNDFLISEKVITPVNDSNN